MEEIVLLTSNEALKTELSRSLPKGVRASSLVPEAGQSLIVFDLDTMKAGLIRDLSAAHFVIAVTKEKDTERVMEATTFGAYEVLHRPLSDDIVGVILEEVRQLIDEMKLTIPVAASALAPTCAIVGHSSVIMNACKKLARLSQVEAPVLVTGETGTGKELIAESIAQLSSRFGKPFVVVNCAAVPESLLEAELFGFEKGSFTGAVASKEGILKIADEGCVFLDEVGELSLALQAKLLRFLQTQTFYPLGSTREIQVNVRVISATNRDLAAMVKEGSFREDLYHRLRVTTIHAPPLRERKEDILPLIHFFVNRYRNTAPRTIKGITSAFLERMVAHSWPGNIRELENSIRSALALSKTHYLTTFEIKELGELQATGRRDGPSEGIEAAIIPFVRGAVERGERQVYEKIHREVDRHVLEYALSRSKENQSEAARILGISRLTLRKKLGY
ncbi:MAG: sigma-54 interaction domain-containing protein [Chloroflexota bacterium]